MVDHACLNLVAVTDPEGQVRLQLRLSGLLRGPSRRWYCWNRLWSVGARHTLSADGSSEKGCVAFVGLRCCIVDEAPPTNRPPCICRSGHVKGLRVLCLWHDLDCWVARRRGQGSQGRGGGTPRRTSGRCWEGAGRLTPWEPTLAGRTRHD